MKIREEKAESQRLINLCNSEIIRYQAALKKAQDALESKTGYMKAKLLEYFQTVPRKTSKTQETYKLPSGTLKMKFPAPEYVKDEDKLTEWLKKMGYTDYIKTVESPKWGDFKPTTQIQKLPIVDDEGEITGYQINVLDANGKQIDGVTAVEKPPVFEVEV